MTAKVSEDKKSLESRKNERKTYWFFLILFGFFILTVGGTVSYILLFLEIPIILLIVRLSIQVKSLKKTIKKDQNSPEYLKGMEDFPREFYNYETLGHLMYLIQVNRARTLPEAFNLLENIDYQARQEAISKQNLAYAKETSKSVKKNTFLNALTA